MTIRMLIFLSFFVFFPKAYATYNLNLNVGYGLASSQEMRDKNLNLKGLSQKVKFGVIPGGSSGSSLSEFGVAFANQSFSGATEHDGVDIEIKAKMNVLEFYYTHYVESLYFELGYSRSSIVSDVEGDLSSTQKVAVKNIYELDNDGFNSDAFRFLLGYKLFNTNNFAISTFGSYTIHQSSSFRETFFGLEFKIIF